MPEHPPPPPPDRVGRAYRVALGLFLAGLAVPAWFRHSPGWETAYLFAARELRDGLDIFAHAGGYVYPPFGALLAVPFTFLPDDLGRAAWVVLNVLAAFVFIRGAWRLAGGRLPGEPGTGWRDHVVVWLGAACTAGLVLDVVSNRQTDLFVAALMVVGANRLLRGRGVTAGVLFGLAAALKCAPLLWAPYLAWRRQWVAAAAVVATFVGANVLPDLVYPDGAAPPRLVRWADRLLAPMAGKDYDPGMWTSGIGFNHSLSGVLNRWLTTERARATVDGKDYTATVVRPDRASAGTLKALVGGTAVLLGLACLVVTRRRADAPLTRPAPATVAEFGLVLSLLLLLSPMASKPHFCTLLVPQWLLARLGWVRGDRPLAALTAITAVLGLTLNKDLVTGRVNDEVMWYGGLFGLCVLLFAGCAYARWKYPEPTPGERGT